MHVVVNRSHFIDVALYSLSLYVAFHGSCCNLSVRIGRNILLTTASAEFENFAYSCVVRERQS